jgi:hypothetical protein
MKIICCISFFVFLIVSCSKFSHKAFKKVSPAKSGVKFLNELIENDTLNYTIFPYMYMGGGVSVGDINNDDLPDIFFTGNLVSNSLYLNKGNMHFEDISESAGIEGIHQWHTGSTMADVNNDGWLDIYVCVSAKYKPSDNLLFINNKDNTFTESAASYGINDQSSSVQATFFDYNNDNYLDLYVANYPIVLVSMGATFYYNKMQENNYEESGHLYKNNGNGTFTCVTKEAGVQNFGMSIGVVAMDYNNDGWKDLYISNDFNPPDYFYINNGDGTFTEVVKEATFQTSIFGMGLDAADINNDGLIDIFQIDMTPEDHYRSMVNVIPMSYQTFYMSLDYGFHYQYMQNSLQLNNGIFNNLPVYSNISLFAGVAYTDWSWGGLFLDMDNDGYKDLFVTNGVLKDINNRDVLDDSKNNIYFAERKEYRPELFPSTPVKNYVYKNNGDLTFSNKTDAWGFDEPNLTNGMSFGDFDNDGDLDIVICTVNTISGIYENRSAGRNNHFLKVKLKGPSANLFGLGSVVTVQTGNMLQKQELTLTRGYQSSVPPVIHFGLGANAIIDELKITWPDGRQQILYRVSVDQTLVLDYKNAASIEKKPVALKSEFKDITNKTGITFIHHEDKYDDFECELLLPHKNSQMGPGLTIGDVNNDGLDDFFIGNAANSNGAMYLQTKEGTFAEVSGPWESDSLYEDTGALLFDADNDEKLDLYLVSGGNDGEKEWDYYQDRLYLNTDQGFIKCENSLPADLNQSGKCVKAADYDNDGDLDLFLGGRIVPAKYPLPANSYILKNNGKPGMEVKFENVTEQIAPALINLGLVTDAIWNDFDNDGDKDLIIVGEWMKIHFFENSSGAFNDITKDLGFDKTVGWWMSINNADIDKDGDDDFVVGNIGLNQRYNTSDEEPFEIFSNDFDVNGKMDIVLSHSKNGKKLPVRGLDASSRQIPVIKLRYEGHEKFAGATLEEIYGKQMLENSLHYTANTFAHYWIENQGRGKFEMHLLPNRAQFSSINDMAEIDYLNDGSAYIVAGNFYSSEVETPRCDASVGLILTSDARREMKAIPPAQSNLLIKGEVKAIEKINLASGKVAFLFAINNGSLKLIEPILNP